MNNRIRLVPLWVKALLVLALIGGLVAYQELRPLPTTAAVSMVPESVTTPGTPPTIPWPTHGSAAVAVNQIGVIGTSGLSTPAPIASVAKAMTALVVLEDKSIKPHEGRVAPNPEEPQLTVTAADVADYKARLDAGESTVQVSAGEQLLEYQALQGLLIPSGNNIADLLAKWDAGSVDAFLVRMNAKAKQLGMKDTTFVDTSGVNPRTASTPVDLIKLGEAAMNIPAFVEIVAQPQAVLPVAGVVYNVDSIVGKDGIIGIKTGSSDAARSCFLFAARRDPAASTTGIERDSIVGAVMGQDTLADAFKLSLALVDTVRPGIQKVHLFNDHQVLGRYETPWGAKTSMITNCGIDTVVLGCSIDVLSYSGMRITIRASLPSVRAPANSVVGQVEISINHGVDTVNGVGITNDRPLAAPSWTWRLTRLG
jgi:D-alanyl-D-alanine carboxypeptidase (penicillin-binding protein 5/6)